MRDAFRGRGGRVEHRGRLRRSAEHQSRRYRDTRVPAAVCNAGTMRLADRRTGTAAGDSCPVDATLLAGGTYVHGVLVLGRRRLPGRG